MESSKGVGAMAVFAVSGSVVLVSLQLYKRLLSNFMKKVESELGGHVITVWFYFVFGVGAEIYRPKRKVRFADDVLEPSSNNKEYRMRRSRLGSAIDHVQAMANAAEERNKLKNNMPPNRLALYEAVALKGHPALRV